MGEKDLTEKILEDYNDVFADIVNVLLFDGQEIVKASSLENSSVHSQYKADDSKIHEQERDVSKKWKDYNTTLALYGIENQTKIEKMMPLRIMGYEGASYRSQFLKSTNRPVPIVTLVLYYGEKHWNEFKTLKEIIEIPDGLDSYVNDFRIHVFEISWLEEEQINKFTSDFRIVANFFVNKRKDKNYIPNDKTTIKHVDEVLKLLKVMTGDSRYEKILVDSKVEVKNMCEVAERLENIGRMEGRMEGRAEERVLIIQNMLESKFTVEQIVSVGFTKEEIEKASDIISSEKIHTSKWE